MVCFVSHFVTGKTSLSLEASAGAAEIGQGSMKGAPLQHDVRCYSAAVL
jgi:hypothetical protein